MNPDNDIARRIETVKLALVDHLRAAENAQLKDFEVINVNHRSFSTIVHLRIATSRINKRLVMKTVNHHPINKDVTDRENQAVIEYNVLKHLYPKFQEIENCSVPRPILVIPEIETYVMEFVEGDLLADKFRFARYFSSKGKFERLKEHYYHCGRWLRHFQNFTGVHTAGPEALEGVIGRCKYRLKLIEDLGDPRCPKDLGTKVMALLEGQLAKLSGNEIFVSGRHGDFGAWNIFVGPRGITVIDFLGYGEDLVPLDLLKMLMNFEDERKYLAYSGRRVQDLRKSFLEGFGSLPFIPEPVLIICEAFHRICSVLACLSNIEERLHRGIERYLCLKANLEWFVSVRNRKLLWPSGN